MDTIEFKCEEFRIREIDLPTIGNVYISTISLNDKLLDEKGSYVSEEASRIDEQIYFFVEEEQIVFREEELTKIILSQVL